MTTTLDTPPTIERETLHFPQFADWDFEEINGAAELKKIKEEAAKPLVVREEKPLPWWHWSNHQSLIDARLMRALADEGRLSEEKVKQIKRKEN